MIFSKTTLKRRGKSPSPCLTLVLIPKGWNISPLNLMLDFVDFVLLRVGLMRFISFGSIPDSLRTLKNVFNYIIGLSKIYKGDHYSLVCKLYFLMSLFRLKICSALDIPFLNPSWYSPIFGSISSSNLSKKILERILYVISRRDIPR